MVYEWADDGKQDIGKMKHAKRAGRTGHSPTNII